MFDPFGRNVNYLRVSITDRCNLRCIYCMPPDGLPWIARDKILTYEEIARLLGALAPLGVSRVRITGGEPLVRPGVADLIAMIRSIRGIQDISLSTNGILLAAQAEALKRAGLNRVNISLDTLHPDRFRKIALRDGLDNVLEGIRAAEEAGLHPIKINMVVIRGTNDDELPDFARMTLDRPWHVRFIEFMPLQENEAQQKGCYMSSAEVLDRLRTLDRLEPAIPVMGNGPARYYKLPGARGSVGVINPMSHTFCSKCNKIRLTAEGRLRLCLFGDNEVDFRTPLRAHETSEQLQRRIREAMLIKPERHYLAEFGAQGSELRALSQVGG